MATRTNAASAAQAGVEPEKREFSAETAAFGEADHAHEEAFTPASESGATSGDSARLESELDASTDDASAGDEAADETIIGAGNALSDEEILRAIGALVFASPDPISARRLALLLEGPELARVQSALVAVRERLAASGLPLELREIAGGFQILTTSEMGPTVQRLFKARRAERISAAALETLSVIAYRQPVTKAEIEAIRGVQAGPILRSLIDKGLVRVTGRADVPGHPLHYGTTKEFLDRFGLASLEELPRDAELSQD